MTVIHANGDRTFTQQEIETMLHIERVNEREACAQVVLGTQFLSNPMSYDLDAIAERIRNRPNTSK